MSNSNIEKLEPKTKLSTSSASKNNIQSNLNYNSSEDEEQGINMLQDLLVKPELQKLKKDIINVEEKLNILSEQIINSNELVKVIIPLMSKIINEVLTKQISQLKIELNNTSNIDVKVTSLENYIFDTTSDLEEKLTIQLDKYHQIQTSILKNNNDQLYQKLNNLEKNIYRYQTTS